MSIHAASPWSARRGRGAGLRSTARLTTAGFCRWVAGWARVSGWVGEVGAAQDTLQGSWLEKTGGARGRGPVHPACGTAWQHSTALPLRPLAHPLNLLRPLAHPSLLRTWSSHELTQWRRWEASQVRSGVLFPTAPPAGVWVGGNMSAQMRSAASAHMDACHPPSTAATSNHRRPQLNNPSSRRFAPVSDRTAPAPTAPLPEVPSPACSQPPPLQSTPQGATSRRRLAPAPTQCTRRR